VNSSIALMTKASINEAGHINLGKAEALAKLIKEMKLSQDNYVDDRFYPSTSMDEDLQLMFFIAMTAIDHRLVVPGHSYEDEMNGNKYRGADLLWIRGKRLFDSDPSIFSPSRLATIDSSTIKHWFGDIWDYGVRTFLLQDIGIKMSKLFNSSPTALIKRSEGYLFNGGHGFIELLKSFSAYTDPVEKKAMLLAKFLHGRGLIRFVDTWNEEVPVDNHLTRIAIRLGLVEPSQQYMEMIMTATPFTPQQDIALRFSIRYGWKLVSILSGIEPFALDDFLWNFGRTICTTDDPKCKYCPLSDVCSLKDAHPREHVFHITYWY